jgi:hypothetical protein
MKAIHGKMNMRLNYEFVELIEMSGCCDNCEKCLNIIVVLKDQNGNSYKVGTDCAESIIEANNRYIDGYLEYVEAQKELRRARKFDLFLRKHIEKTIIKTGVNGRGMPWKNYLLLDQDRFVKYRISDEEFLKLSDKHQSLINNKK